MYRNCTEESRVGKLRSSRWRTRKENSKRRSTAADGSEKNLATIIRTDYLVRTKLRGIKRKKSCCVLERLLPIWAVDHSSKNYEETPSEGCAPPLTPTFFISLDISALYFRSIPFLTMSALAEASVFMRRMVPKGARNWSRALPSLEVSHVRSPRWKLIAFVLFHFASSFSPAERHALY
jgi:hypothetical protein